jgi:hypothetical protein
VGGLKYSSTFSGSGTNKILFGNAKILRNYYMLKMPKFKEITVLGCQILD